MTSQYCNTLKITAFKLFFIRRNVMVEWLEICCFPTPQHLFEESLKFLMHILTRLKNSVFFPRFSSCLSLQYSCELTKQQPNDFPKQTEINLGSRCQSLLRAVRVPKCTLKKKTLKDPSLALAEMLMCAPTSLWTYVKQKHTLISQSEHVSNHCDISKQGKDLD